MGGGAEGSIGATWSWIVGVVACLLIVARHHQLARASASASAFRAGRSGPNISSSCLGCVLVLGDHLGLQQLLLAGRHRQEICRGTQYRLARDGGLEISYGIAIPVLIALVVGIVMTFVATRLRFGRYVFAIGGNPEAAELAGIKTRWVTVRIFALMGLLCRHRCRNLDRTPQRRHQFAGHDL